MAFPSIHANSLSGSSTGSSTLALTYPTGIVAGDKLIVCVTFDGNPTTSGWPTGWTQRASVTDATNAVRVQVYEKNAIGTETGSFNISVSASEAQIFEFFRISGADATAIEVTTATGSSTNPNPPANDPAGWATEDTLWIAYAGGDGGTTAFTAAPTSYGTLVARTVSNAANGVASGYGSRQNAVGSEDPATFTRATEQWCAVTIAIRTNVATDITDSGTVGLVITPSASEVYTTPSRGRVYWLEFDIPSNTAVGVDYEESVTVGLVITPSGVDTMVPSDANTVGVLITPSGVETTGTIYTDSNTVSVVITVSGVDVYAIAARGRVYWVEFEVPIVSVALEDSGIVRLAITPSADEFSGATEDSGAVAVVITVSGTDEHVIPSPARRGRVYWIEFETPLANILIDSGTVTFTITPSGSDQHFTIGGTAYTDSGTVAVTLTIAGVEESATSRRGRVYWVELETPLALPVYETTGTVTLTITVSAVEVPPPTAFIDSGTVYVDITPIGDEYPTGVPTPGSIRGLMGLFVSEAYEADVATVTLAITPSSTQVFAAVDSATVRLNITPSTVGLTIATVTFTITPATTVEYRLEFDTLLSGVLSGRWSGSLTDTRRFSAGVASRYSATLTGRLRYSASLNERKYAGSSSSRWTGELGRS